MEFSFLFATECAPHVSYGHVKHGRACAVLICMFAVDEIFGKPQNAWCIERKIKEALEAARISAISMDRGFRNGGA